MSDDPDDTRAEPTVDDGEVPAIAPPPPGGGPIPLPLSPPSSVEPEHDKPKREPTPD